MPKGVTISLERHLASLEDRTLGDRHHGVPARVGGSVGHEQAGQSIDIHGNFGDGGAVHPGEVRRDQRRLSAVPAEQLDDGDAFMGCCARPQVVNRLETPRHGGRESDAVVRAIDVVVHGLGDGDDRHSLLMEP